MKTVYFREDEEMIDAFTMERVTIYIDVKDGKYKCGLIVCRRDIFSIPSCYSVFSRSYGYGISAKESYKNCMSFYRW